MFCQQTRLPWSSISGDREFLSRNLLSALTTRCLSSFPTDASTDRPPPPTAPPLLAAAPWGRVQIDVAAVRSSSAAARTRNTGLNRHCPLLLYCHKDVTTGRRLPLAALLCGLIDASEGLRHHRPLHLCCHTDVSGGRRGRLPLSSADPRVRAQSAAVATLRLSPPSHRTLIR